MLTFIATVVLSCAPILVHAFPLHRVILSTNNDPLYIQFWPIVAPIWESMGIRPTLALIATEDCPIDTSIGDVLRFDPLPDVPEALQAQAIRLLIPAFFPDDVCLISDIDMLPMSPSYFIEWALPCPDDAFLVYRDIVWGDSSRYTMCYNAAKGRVFAEIFGVHSLEDIPKILRYWNSLQLGWETDELVLFADLIKWENKGNLVMRLGHFIPKRLDRGQWKIDDSFDASQWVDCHCPRPYMDHKESIDIVLKSLKEHIEDFCRNQ
jgi:hypothetical protein